MKQSSEFSLRGVAELSLVISVVLLLLHFYNACFPAFAEWGWTCKFGDRIMVNIGATHLFDSGFRCKLIIGLFLGLGCLAYGGRKDQRAKARQALEQIGSGLLLYFGSIVVFARLGSVTATSVFYMVVTATGWVLMLMGGILATRIMGGPRSASDPFGKQQAGFPQEEKKRDSEFALHLKGRYRFEGRERDSWINLINPRRGILVIGSPGSGKSWFIIEPLIRQLMEKGFALFIYDFKFDRLSRLAWRLFQRYEARYPPGTAFYCINFCDLMRSHRCNVLAPDTLQNVSDAIGASRTILMGINRTWAHQDGRFFVESPINLLAAVIWYLRQYEDGRYCTLPHAIELLQVPYNQLLTVLYRQPEVQSLIQTFIDAYENKSLEMLDGQIASARIPLGRLASPELYYILTGNDLNLDINNPGAPKILCLGGDPRRREALAPILSLYIDQVCRLSNAPDRCPCALVCDEFATVRAANMLSTFATARSNNIIPVLAVQDINQLRMQYTKEESDLVLNISGNFFCGQTGGETARWVSERFPKVLKDRQSISINSGDTAITITPHWEEVVTPATMATLSSGEFVGVTADDPEEEMPLKGFHAKILRREIEVGIEGMPVIHRVDRAAVKKHFEQIRQEALGLVRDEVEKVTKGKGMEGKLIK